MLSLYSYQARSHSHSLSLTHMCHIPRTGEANFDHQFTPDAPPQAIAIDMHSNDHYVLDSIVFSSKIGMNMIGAANVVNGLHVWFPWNKALDVGATAFLNTGYSNRYDNCYIDDSVAEFRDPNEVTWTNGFVLAGEGILHEQSMR